MRHFIVASPSYIADRLLAQGSRITDAWLNGAEPGTNLIETDENGVPKKPEDVARLLAAGVNLGPVQVAPVMPHAPNPTQPQAVPGQAAGSVQIAGNREYVPADGVESNEAADARVERLRAELAAAEEAVAKVADASPADLEPEKPRRSDTPPAQEPGPLDGSIEALTAHLETINDVSAIDALIAGEKGGKSRVGALAALDARKAALAPAT